MRLSEAIRLGSMLGKQARGALSRTRRKYLLFGPVVNEYCALGAAFVASGAKTVIRRYDSSGESHGGFRGVANEKVKAGDTYRVVEHEWPQLMWSEVGCPLCPGEVMPLHRLIPHLNDQHRWTRERIADFVEPMEQRSTNSATYECGLRGDPVEGQPISVATRAKAF